MTDTAGQAGQDRVTDTAAPTSPFRAADLQRSDDVARRMLRGACASWSWRRRRTTEEVAGPVTDDLFERWWETGEQHRFRRSWRPDRWFLAICVCGRTKRSVVHV